MWSRAEKREGSWCSQRLPGEDRHEQNDWQGGQSSEEVGGEPSQMGKLQQHQRRKKAENPCLGLSCLENSVSTLSVPN